MARDASRASDDRIEILLDTLGDQRSAFYFATNPAGAMEDGLAFANGQAEKGQQGGDQIVLLKARSGWDWIVFQNRSSSLTGDHILASENSTRQVTERGER